MAYSHVSIDQSKKWGIELLRAVELMREARQQWKKVRDKMATMNDDTDWTHAEQQMGLPTGTGGGVFYQLDLNYGNMMSDGAVTNGHVAMEQMLNQIG